MRDTDNEVGYSLAVAQNLAVAVLKGVNDGDDLRGLGQALLLLRGNKRPELVDVDDRAPLEVAGQVEAAHTDLTEVTRVVLIEVGPIGINSRVETHTFLNVAVEEREERVHW